MWRVEKIRERPSPRESRNEPFFWGSVVVTILLAILSLVSANMSMDWFTPPSVEFSMGTKP